MIERLWSKNFIILIISNGLMYGGFHALLPILPLFATQIGGNGAQVGIIGGIFGISAIFIRFFSLRTEKLLGKKKSLYIGLVISFLCAVGYATFSAVNEIIVVRLIHGLGFGLTTTFYASVVADIVPKTRRGEGLGYFGLGSTLAMAVAPACAVVAANIFGFRYAFLLISVTQIFAFFSLSLCHVPDVPETESLAKSVKTSLLNKLVEKGEGFAAFLTVLVGVGYGSANLFVAMLAKQIHINNSGYFFLVGTLCILISRPLGGTISDKRGSEWVILPGSIMLCLGLITLSQSASMVTLLIAAVFYGFGGGLLLPSLLALMISKVSPERKSAASATYYNSLDIGTSGGSIILGMIAGHTSYTTMYVYSALAMGVFVFSYLFYIFYAVIKRRNNAESLDYSEN